VQRLGEFRVLSIDSVPASGNSYCVYILYGMCCVYFNGNSLHPASRECGK